MWQQDGSTEKTWYGAMFYCTDINLAGFEDWRLPNINELQTLIDHNRSEPPLINTNYFTNTAPSLYWSSTGNATGANTVNFIDGNLQLNSKLSSFYVRAVRGGQTGSSTTTSSDVIPGTSTTTEIPITTTTTITPSAVCEYRLCIAINKEAKRCEEDKKTYQAQTDIYTKDLKQGMEMTVTVEVLSGDADLSVWSPDGKLGWASKKKGAENEEVNFTAPMDGSYRIEVSTIIVTPPDIPQCLSITPAIGGNGDTLDIIIKGEDTHFDTTSEVYIDCLGIAINSLTVTSATEILANITIAGNAEKESCDISIKTGDETITCTNAFTISPCELTEINPSSVDSGVFLPQIALIRITAEKANFDSSSIVTIEGGIKAFPIQINTDQITALIVIPAKTKITPGDKAVTILTGDKECKGVVLNIQ